MSDLPGWTDDAPPPAVRVAGSNRIHAVTVATPGLTRVLFPACGASVGRAATRTPVDDPVDCPACQHLATGGSA